MRWPWRRRRDQTRGRVSGLRRDGGDAQAKRDEAAQHLDDARTQGQRVTEATQAARELVRRTDVFAREIERSLRPRGNT